MAFAFCNKRKNRISRHALSISYDTELFVRTLLFAKSNNVHVIFHPSMALQAFVGPWPLLQFHIFLYRRQDSLDGRSARRKAVAYTHDNIQNKRTHRHPCLEWDSNPRPQCSSERRQFMSQTTRPP
jgi:hypothetical protein